MSRKFKYFIAFIFVTIFSWYYLGWIRKTFPNPNTAYLIRVTSEVIVGACFTYFYIRKSLEHR